MSIWLLGDEARRSAATGGDGARTVTLPVDGELAKAALQEKSRCTSFRRGRRACRQSTWWTTTDGGCDGIHMKSIATVRLPVGYTGCLHTAPFTAELAHLWSTKSGVRRRGVTSRSPPATRRAISCRRRRCEAPGSSSE